MGFFLREAIEVARERVLQEMVAEQCGRGQKLVLIDAQYKLEELRMKAFIRKLCVIGVPTVVFLGLILNG